MFDGRGRGGYFLKSRILKSRLPYRAGERAMGSDALSQIETKSQIE